MIDLNLYKKKYFENELFVDPKEIINHFRNIGIKEEYKNLETIELIKIICDKIFFYNVESQSIKNMLYQNKLFYQDFKKESQIESFLYRLIRENVNRVLIFTGEFSNKNNPKLISKSQINELIKNMDNDIIFLSDNIILVRYQVFLPWLWKCREEPIRKLKELDKFNIYYLKDTWNFSN